MAAPSNIWRIAAAVTLAALASSVLVLSPTGSTAAAPLASAQHHSAPACRLALIF